jgi:hypothetical protein
MQIRAVSLISLAVACSPFLSPGKVPAQTASVDNNAISAAAETMAAQMVPAQAVLDHDLDAKKAKAGQQFRATLTSTIQLKNGMEIPRGTALVGTIAADGMEDGGQLTLALRFTQAQLKDGKTIPIEAAIISISPPYESWDQSTAAPQDQWNRSELAIDQVGVLSGVDLHSRIGGENSGVFVSKRSDMKLAARSQMSLAISVHTGEAMAGAN